MSWTERINNERYLLGSALNLTLALYLGLPSWASAWWLSYVVIASFLNHYFAVKVFNRLFESRVKGAPPAQNKRLILHLFFKVLFLISAFVCLMVFNRDQVLQGVGIYIFQLIILSLSIKNIGQLLKKGSHS